jgi:hypothetical protein
MERRRTAIDFETRLGKLREELDRRAEDGSDEQLRASNLVEEQAFQNGWPNCWGSFNNIVP